MTKIGTMIRSSLFVCFLFVLVGCDLKNESSKSTFSSMEQEEDGGVFQSPSEAILEIKSIMGQQERAWNTGNLEDFMIPYLHSDSLMFIGKRGLTYGWDQTLDNYRKGYPDQQMMGKLSFTHLEFKPLGEKHFFVVGKWFLDRVDLENLEGHYSLIWEKVNGKWLIMADHSS